MMDLTRMIEALSHCIDDEEKENVQVYDLNTDEGLKGYNKQLDQLETVDLDVLNMFGINGKEWIDSMRKLGQKLHDQNNQKKDKVATNKEDIIKKTVNMQRKENDHSEVEDKSFNRPSELLTVDKKLKLHKLVQEYVNTMIKPYNNGILTQEQINDAYAGLYEFAAWIMNK
jgi:hypothetical protein